MGKIVKYCAACDESFAEKFGFCPNCGQVMTAFEMNPLTQQPIVSEAAKTEQIAENIAIPTPALISSVAAPKAEPTPVAETVAVSANQTQIVSNPSKAEKVADVPTATEPTATKTFAAAAGTNGNGNGNGNYRAVNDDFSIASTTPTDDGFHVTVIEEKNSKQRNGLLLGSMVLMVTLALGGTVYSLFNKDLGVGAIDDDALFALVVVDEAPMEVEEQPKPKTDKDAGGGGGGGKEEQQPASKGRLVSQSENPITPPSVNIPQLKNPSLPVIMETEGKIKRPITEERPGLLTSDNLNLSNGNGSGGGIGGGNGRGIGNGEGTGEGNGKGSGSGDGIGNGIGDGKGDGIQGRTPPPPPPPPTRPVGVTTKVKIISKPKPGYTNEARQNQVTGTVRLRVVFTASGQIGSVSPVSGLPNGLTEQAIAAAKGIRFEPAMKNGVPTSSQSIVEYTFSIY